MSYETSRLEEAYKMFINKVLKESVDTDTKKDTVISESAAPVKDYDFDTVIITGDTQPSTIVESVDEEKLSNSIAYDFMRLAGLK